MVILCEVIYLLIILKRGDKLKEIWKDIEGFEGKYRISNLGNVMSYAVYSNGKLMKPKYDKDGYLSIGLSMGKRGKIKYLRIHRLVAITFIPNPNNMEIVNHINGIRDDNRVENLEWCDNSYNQWHRCHINKNPPNNEYKKRKIKTQNIITNETRIFDSIKECGKYYNVSASAIQRRLVGKISNPTTTSNKSNLNYIKISYDD